MSGLALYPAAVADAAYAPLLIYCAGDPPHWWGKLIQIFKDGRVILGRFFFSYL